jgi:hypothetical protein
MRLSWNCLGYAIKACSELGGLTVILSVLWIVWQEGDVLLLAVAAAFSATVVTGCFCAGSALLYLAGILKITCPLCRAV